MAAVAGGTIVNGSPQDYIGPDGDIIHGNKFLATSKHTGEVNEFFSYGAASYWLAVIDERFEACFRRTGRYPTA
jgi:hypothetical protein